MNPTYRLDQVGLDHVKLNWVGSDPSHGSQSQGQYRQLGRTQVKLVQFDTMSSWSTQIQVRRV